MRRSGGSRDASGQLLDVVRDVRRRWRSRQLLQGGAIVLAAGFAVFFASTFGIDRLRFDSTAVLVFRIVLWVTLLALVGWFLVRPLLRRVSDEQVALYLEEHEPTLRSAFMSAVETVKDGEKPVGLDRRVLMVAIAIVHRTSRSHGAFLMGNVPRI